MNILILSILIALYITAIVLIAKGGLPHPFPWWAVYLLAMSFAMHGATESLFYIAAFIASMIIAARASITGRLWTRAGPWISIAITIWLLMDAARIIPTSDIIVANDTIGPLRRPYAFEHPNNMAAWMLLMPWGIWTIAAIVLTQSRGALFGFAPAWVIKTIPRRWISVVGIIGIVVLAGALAFRPTTVASRVYLWEHGMQMFANSPIIGSGSYYLNSPDGPAYTAHNALITVAAENGLVGLIPLAWLLISAGVQIARSGHPARWGLMAFWIQQMFDDQWLHPITSVLLGIVVSVCLFSGKEIIHAISSEQ